MTHATLFGLFRPSLEEVNHYVNSWKRYQNKDYLHYLSLNEVFRPNLRINTINLYRQCVLIDISYKCRANVSYERIVGHYLSVLSVDDNVQRMRQGNNVIIDTLRYVPTDNNKVKDLYVFSSMFCHHSNPTGFYGFSRPIARTLYALNQNAPFANIDNNCANLFNYTSFVQTMESFRIHFGLTEISNTELDVSLRGIYKEFKNDININFGGHNL